MIDWGYPGVLPVMNKAAIEFGMKAALALNCEISKKRISTAKLFLSRQSKAYHFRNSINRSVMMGGSRSKWKAKEKIRIERVHLEEDAGKTCTAKAVILMLI